MKILSSLVFGALSSLVATQALAQSANCRSTDEKEIASLFDRWNDTLKSGDPKQVTANYATQSVLLPTLSNTPRLTPAEKEDYFKVFLAKKPVGKIDSRTIAIDCTTALDTGLYTFSFGDGSEAKARYTFTYKWDGDKWLITSHHSSAMPEGSGKHSKH